MACWVCYNMTTKDLVLAACKFYLRLLERVDRNMLCEVVGEWRYSQQLIRTMQGLYNGTGTVSYTHLQVFILH